MSPDLSDHVATLLKRLQRLARGDDLRVLELAIRMHDAPASEREACFGKIEDARFAAAVKRVIEAFGRIWKCPASEALEAFVETHRPVLPTVLRFELIHEGEATPAMRAAADRAGLTGQFNDWERRVSSFAR